MLKRGDTGQEAERDWNFVACEFRGLHGEGKPRDEKYFVQSVSLENSFDRRVVCPLVDCVSELSNDKLSRKPIGNSFLDPLHSCICIHPRMDINVHLSIEEKGEHSLSW